MTEQKISRQRKYQLENKSMGLCIKCGKDSPRTSTCRACYDRKYKKRKEVLSKLQQDGLCVICKEPRGSDGTKNHCRKHADLATQQVINSRLKAQRRNLND